MKTFNFNKNKDVEIKSSHYCYDGFLKIKEYHLQHRLYDGNWSPILKRQTVERGMVAAALPYDPLQDKIILIEQFRVGALSDLNPWLLEIVAGIADDKDNTPEELILREIQEESGLSAQELYKMHDFWSSPGGSNEFVSLYCAKVTAPLVGGIYGLQEEHEDIYVHVLDIKTAFELLAQDKIKNAITIIALQWLQLHHQDIKQAWINK